MTWALCVVVLQLTTYAERLRFAEQEAMQAQSNAVEKSKMAKEVREAAVEPNPPRATASNKHNTPSCSSLVHRQPVAIWWQ
jgi:hypothetical protein